MIKNIGLKAVHNVSEQKCRRLCNCRFVKISGHKLKTNSTFTFTASDAFFNSFFFHFWTSL